MKRVRKYLYRVVWVTGDCSMWFEYKGNHFINPYVDDIWFKTVEFKNVLEHPQVEKFYDKYRRKP